MSPIRSQIDMALSYKARRRWSLLILLVGMPVYVVVAVTVVSRLDRLPPLVEIPVYVALGVAWILPFRFIFRGVGKADPGPDPEASKADPAPDDSAP